MNRKYNAIIFLICFSVALPSLIYLVQAETSSIAWSPYVPFQFTAYNTDLQSSKLWYFSSFSLSNSSLTFYNTYIGSGAPINSLTIQSPTANLTLDSLSITGTTSINATGNGVTTISLSGFLEAPLTVTNDGSPFYYSYSRSSDTLTLYPVLSGSSEIILTFPNLNPNFIINIFGLSLMALSLFAIVPIISAVGLIISLVLLGRSGRKIETKEVIGAIVLVVVVDVVIILAIVILSNFQNAVTTVTFLKLKEALLCLLKLIY